MRKLGIPCVRDKGVQEAMRLILEAIYDSPYGPYFCETSHGFQAQPQLPHSITRISREVVSSQLAH